MKVFIPSYKRAGQVATRRTLGGAGIIVCHEFEADAYRRAEGGELLVVPDALKGNIARVRNFILDQAGDARVVMLDDDIQWVCVHEAGAQRRLEPAEIFALLEHGYTLARDLGARLWGLNLNVDPMCYREYSPLGLLAPVLGTFSCHLEPELRYDEDLYLNEDYDFFLQNIARYRKVLRLNKYAYRARHLDQAGGCAAYRLKPAEVAQAERMQRRWGRKVFRFDIGRSTNGRVFMPLGGV